MCHHAKFRAILVKPLRKYDRFSIFQDGGCPPSWICFTCIWSTHEECLVVFVAVQNLVGINADNMPVFMFCELA